MPSKLLLIGGVSCSGKTTICEQLKLIYDIGNRRLHNYVLELAREKGIENAIGRWSDLAPESMRRLICDVQSGGSLTCDIHFSVQQNVDTAYALGKDFVEDINEPYIKGVEDKVLQVFESFNIDLYLLLLDSAVKEVWGRRKELAKNKKQRSLNPLSIKREKFYEKKYFDEAANVLIQYTNVNVSIVRNTDGELPKTLDEIVQICDIGGQIR